MIKQITIGIILALGLFGNASSQIKQDICFDTLALKAGEFRMHIREFGGCFSFNKLPSALEPVTVTFTLEITTKRTEHLAKSLEEDWVLQLYYYNNIVKVTGDTLFYWTGPHKFGDKFTGSFEFIPLKSGRTVICLDFKGYKKYMLPPRIAAGISFEYCFDENGKLLLLDQYLARTRDECRVLKTYFIPPDSIVIGQYPHTRDTYAFGYDIIVTPIPEIGKVSKVIYRLYTNEDLDHGVNQMITTKGIDINSLPLKMDQALSKSQIIEQSLKFTPRPIRSTNDLALHFIYVTKDAIDKDNIGTQTIPLELVFNPDGSLRLINNGTIGFGNIDYPDNFPEHDSDRDNKTININVIDVEDFRK